MHLQCSVHVLGCLLACCACVRGALKLPRERGRRHSVRCSGASMDVQRGIRAVCDYFRAELRFAARRYPRTHIKYISEIEYVFKHCVRANRKFRRNFDFWVGLFLNFYIYHYHVPVVMINMIPCGEGIMHIIKK